MATLAEAQAEARRREQGLRDDGLWDKFDLMWATFEEWVIAKDGDHLAVKPPQDT